MKEEPLKESRCLPLTSNNLLEAALNTEQQKVISVQTIELTEEQRKNLTIGIRLPSLFSESV